MTQRSLLDFFKPPDAKRAKPDEQKPSPAPLPAAAVADVDAVEEIDDDSQTPPKKAAPAPILVAAPAAEATWWWMNDQGNWVAFSTAVSKMIEEARLANKPRAAVDAQRFVDIPSMTQRRNDDPEKRRPVKRTIGVTAANAVPTPAPLLPPSAAARPLVVKPPPSAVVAAARPLVVKPPPPPAVVAAAAVPVAVRWMWRDDNGWKEYDMAMADKLEAAFQAKRDKVPVDGDRFVDLKSMWQMRFDDNQKRRAVKREVVVDGRGGDGGGGGGVVPIKWLFCVEEASNTWSEYPADVSARIEEAAKRKIKTAKVDDERFVDLVNMVQRRFDDKTRMRYVRRGTAPAGARVTPLPAIAPSPRVKPIVAAVAAPLPHPLVVAPTGDGDATMLLPLADDGDETEPDEKLQRLARNAPDSGEVADSGDETEDDEALKQLAAIPPAPDIVAAAAAAAPIDPDKTAVLPAIDAAAAAVVDSDDNDDALPTDSEDETTMSLDDRRKRYRCGAGFSTLADIPTWQQWLDKKPRIYRIAYCLPSAALNTKISLWQGDMTAVELDAIVNAAKPSLMGGGGIDGAIHKAAGHRLHEYCLKLGGCNVGESKLTPGFRLPAKYIIHTVGPIGEKPDLLIRCYTSLLDLAKANGIRTLAVCCISTGIYGYPNKTAAHVALRTVRKWLDKPENAATIDRIIFCVFLDRDKHLYKLYAPQYFPPVPKL